MKIGLVYPQTEYSSDPIAIRDYAQTAEALGFTHILAYDHVLGANPERPGGWDGPYTCHDPFQELFTLFSFMAGITSRIEFASGVFILPQRQTALFAKQAANLDVYCGGRLRLGVGIGWNEVEYTSLNENFRNRGKRFEEQVEVLRLLWTQPLVNFQGRWHHIPDAGLNPMPVQRPIPLWFGGSAEPVLERTARLADGWMPNFKRVAGCADPLWIRFTQPCRLTVETQENWASSHACPTAMATRTPGTPSFPNGRLPAPVTSPSTPWVAVSAPRSSIWPPSENLPRDYPLHKGNFL